MAVRLSLILLARVFCARSEFLVPSEQAPYEEVFQYDEFYEYIISSQALEWDQAGAVCQYVFDGVLATLETDHLLQFVAEAMSESSTNLDGLWVGLLKRDGSFKWLDVDVVVPDAQFTKCGNSSLSASKSTCGAFVRANHTLPCLVSLPCDVNRGFICKRPVDRNEPSTHRGWIKVGRRLYKIFSKQLSYDDANKACMDRKWKANLAVVETCADAQILGRYLLVGRPSLERVWMGARWADDFSQYEFQSEPIVLSNVTNKDECPYPPWRRGRMKRPLGCLLLDRHLSNVTYFVESSCSRLHSYMCYKMEQHDGPVDVCNLGDYDWRIYYKKLDWFQATNECNRSAKSGRLPAIERKDLKYLIYIMESSKFYLFHIWMGAFFVRGVWTWSYTNRVVPREIENGYPPWIVNASYDDEVEKRNLCLNLDRENALVPLFYGTLCSFAQSFVCQYDKGTICHNYTTTETPMTTQTELTTTSTKSTTTKTKPTTTTKTKTTTTTSKPTTTSTKSTTTKTKPTTTTKTKTTTTSTTSSKTKTNPATPKTTSTTHRTRPTTKNAKSTTEGPLMFTNTTPWMRANYETTGISVNPTKIRTRPHYRGRSTITITTQPTIVLPTRKRPTKPRPTRHRPTRHRPTRHRPTRSRTRPTTDKPTTTKHAKPTRHHKGGRKTTEGLVELTTTPPWLPKRMGKNGWKNLTTSDFYTAKVD